MNLKQKDVHLGVQLFTGPLAPMAYSSFLGWVSIASWIVVYSPQLIENYRLKSGEGLSVAFVLIWLAGDLSNLTGAVLAHLLPTVIILAIYFSLCDLGLLFQIYYYRYNHLVHIGSPVSTESSLSENAPLLPSPETPDCETNTRRVLLKVAPYASSAVFVLAVGYIGCLMDNPTREEEWPQRDIFEWRSQIAGWLSAFLYIISRIPQIFKNLKTKCSGLSPVLFTFAMVGNMTYVASILVISTEPRYLAVNASWLVGSTVTIFLDLSVLAQFFYFRSFDRISNLQRLRSIPHEEL